MIYSGIYRCICGAHIYVLSIIYFGLTMIREVQYTSCAVEVRCRCIRITWQNQNRNKTHPTPCCQKRQKDRFPRARGDFQHDTVCAKINISHFWHVVWSVIWWWRMRSRCYITFWSKNRMVSPPPISSPHSTVNPSTSALLNESTNRLKEWCTRWPKGQQ